MKNRKYIIPFIIGMFLLSGSAIAQSIPQLSPWFYDGSNNITQIKVNTPIKITGLTPGGCLQLTSLNIATTTGSPCSSGGGSSTGNVATSSQETSGYFPTWTSTNGTPALLSGTSQLFQNGANVGVGTTSPWAKFSIGSYNQAVVTPLFVVASSSVGVATSTLFEVNGVGSALISDGTAAAPALSFLSASDMGLYKGGSQTLSIATAGTQRATFDATNIQFYPNSTGNVKILNGSTLELSGGALNGGPAAASPVATTINGAAGSGTNIAGGTLTLGSGLGTGTGTESATIFKGPVRVASGTGAQTSQELMRLSYDNSATFAKLNLGVNNSFQTQLILNGASGTQTLALGTNGVTATVNSGSTPLRLTTSDTTNGVSIGSSPLTWVTDNTYDIGASGATRPRTLYLGTSAIAPAGTAGAPAYTFDAGTGGIGMYRIGNGLGLGTGSNGNVGFAVSGGAVSFLQFTGSNTSNTAVFNVTTGSARSGSSAAQVFASLTPTYNQTSTAGATDFLINRTETAVGTGAQFLMDAQVAGISKFNITNTGKVGVGTTTPYLNSIITAVGTTTVQGQIVSLMASTTSGTSLTGRLIDFSTGNTQRLTLNANATLVINATSSNPIDGAKYVLKLCQDATGSRTVMFVTPGQLVWYNGTTTATTTPNTANLIGMIYDAREQKYNVIASTTIACTP